MSENMRLDCKLSVNLSTELKWSVSQNFAKEQPAPNTLLLSCGNYVGHILLKMFNLSILFSVKHVTIHGIEFRPGCALRIKNMCEFDGQDFPVYAQLKEIIV